MKKESEIQKSPHRRWAIFRHSVIGQLIAAPPDKGELRGELAKLAAKEWVHPINGQSTSFSFSTIESWYYSAKKSKLDPVGVLASKTRSDIGLSRKINEVIAEMIKQQYAAYPYWNYQLHSDNLHAKLSSKNIAPLPSYQTVSRYMQGNGYIKRKKPRNLDGAAVVINQHEARETRSYEVEFVNALWHLDFHKNPKKVLVDNGQWMSTILLGIFDDYSRLCCHMQWYLQETAECLVHGFSQAILKRDVPMELLNDNGSAMISAEFTEGLARLGVKSNRTRPRTPNQNGKCEFVWNRVEGRLMAMLDGQEYLTLKQLNDITQAWVEMEYNRTPHDETKEKPIDRFCRGKVVGTPCPTIDTLRFYFQRESTRTQRRSDGTISLESRRYEIPSRFRNMQSITVKYALWDMSYVHMIDPRNGNKICRIYPVDKAKNADGMRRAIENPVVVDVVKKSDELPALLQKLIADHKHLMGVPAYLPKDDSKKESKNHE